MARITVTVRSDIGDPGVHHRLGQLVPGQSVEIEEEEFGPGLFERPSTGWLSPHELADKARGEELQCSVGTFEYVDPAPVPEAPTGKKRAADVVAAPVEEVKTDA